MVIKKINNDEMAPLVAEHLSSDQIFGRYLKAIDEAGKVLGFVGYARRIWFLSEIRHLFVLPEHRRSGVGRELAEEAIRRTKAPLICATVIQANEAAIRLFTSLGFAVKETFLNQETGNTICLLMRKKGGE